MTKRKCKAWNHWQREQSVVVRSLCNAEVKRLFAARWPEIRRRLKMPFMDDALSDTYLRMTRLYDGSRDFADQFVEEHDKTCRQLRYSRRLAGDLPLTRDLSDALAEET